MASPDTTELFTRLFREAAIIDEAVRRHVRHALAPPLTEAGFGVLSHLRFTDNRNETPGDLARLFDVSRPSMTQLLSRLVRDGFVTLHPAPHDGRVRLVQLTPEGRLAHGQVIARVAPFLEGLARRFDAADVAETLERLRTLREALEAVPAPGANDHPRTAETGT